MMNSKSLLVRNPTPVLVTVGDIRLQGELATDRLCEHMGSGNGQWIHRTTATK